MRKRSKRHLRPVGYKLPTPQDINFLHLMHRYMEHKQKTGSSPAFAKQIGKTMRHLCLVR